MTDDFQLELEPVVSEAQLNSPSTMVRKLGFGETGKQCMDCKHYEKRYFNKKTYCRCAAVKPAGVHARGIKPNWPACKLFRNP